MDDIAPHLEGWMNGVVKARMFVAVTTREVVDDRMVFHMMSLLANAIACHDV